MDANAELMPRVVSDGQGDLPGPVRERDRDRRVGSDSRGTERAPESAGDAVEETQAARFVAQELKPFTEEEDAPEVLGQGALVADGRAVSVDRGAGILELGHVCRAEHPA